MENIYYKPKVDYQSCPFKALSIISYDTVLLIDS